MMLDLLKTLPQYFLPQHLLSTWMHGLMNIRQRQMKNFTIVLMARIFHINMAEAQSDDPDDYTSFNDFFARALKPGVRPLGDAPIVCPADGVLSQMRVIRETTLIQAKGQHYDLLNLLAGNVAQASKYANGHYQVVYLSPKDYHRVHMPVTGKILAMTYVPGNLFAVNRPTVRQIPRLFARNERTICYGQTQEGVDFVLILVGAIFVGSMTTVWHGKITPEYGKALQHWDYTAQPIALNKGDELGRFNMGSTVVMLWPQDKIIYETGLAADEDVKMGENLAWWSAGPNTSSITDVFTDDFDDLPPMIKD